MRINGQVVVKLDSLGINMDNFEALEKADTNTSWDTKGHNEIIFFIEYASDLEDIEEDIKNIQLAVEQFEEENTDTSNTWSSEELHHYYSQNTI